MGERREYAMSPNPKYDHVKNKKKSRMTDEREERERGEKDQADSDSERNKDT